MDEPKRKNKRFNLIKNKKFELNPNSFLKLHSFEKILHQHLNKNFLAQKDEKLYFNEIKLQICKIFEFLLNYRFEYHLTHAMGYFNEFFLEKVNEKNLIERKKEIFENMAQIFPSDVCEIGHANFIKNYIKSFDEIINKPFIECLLIAFYFNRKTKEVENCIVNLIMKYCSQKTNFRKLFTKIELLITNEDKTLYQSMNSILKKLNDNAFKIQVLNFFFFFFFFLNYECLNFSKSWFQMQSSLNFMKYSLEISEFNQTLQKMENIFSCSKHNMYYPF